MKYVPEHFLLHQKVFWGLSFYLHLQFLKIIIKITLSKILKYNTCVILSTIYYHIASWQFVLYFLRYSVRSVWNILMVQRLTWLEIIFFLQNSISILVLHLNYLVTIVVEWTPCLWCSTGQPNLHSPSWCWEQ